MGRTSSPLLCQPRALSDPSLPRPPPCRAEAPARAGGAGTGAAPEPFAGAPSPRAPKPCRRAPAGRPLPPARAARASSNGAVWTGAIRIGPHKRDNLSLPRPALRRRRPPPCCVPTKQRPRWPGRRAPCAPSKNVHPADMQRRAEPAPPRLPSTGHSCRGLPPPARQPARPPAPRLRAPCMRAAGARAHMHGHAHARACTCACMPRLAPRVGAHAHACRGRASHGNRVNAKNRSARTPPKPPALERTMRLY
jgi:hypothetical protein